MTGTHTLALVALFLCLIGLSYRFARLIKAGPPPDLSKARSNPSSALVYSFLGAMSPQKKESAFLHLPTYTAGLLYHAGTFVAMVLFVVFLSGSFPDTWLRILFVGALSVSSASGIGILLKRVLVLRHAKFLSTPDDYISNILVTVFHVLTVATLIDNSIASVTFVWVSALLLYLPFGKLKHVLYFFAARYQLGLFYGRRGVWPHRKQSTSA